MPKCRRTPQNVRDDTALASPLRSSTSALVDLASIPRASYDRAQARPWFATVAMLSNRLLHGTRRRGRHSRGWEFLAHFVTALEDLHVVPASCKEREF